MIWECKSCVQVLIRYEKVGWGLKIDFLPKDAPLRPILELIFYVHRTKKCKESDTLNLRALKWESLNIIHLRLRLEWIYPFIPQNNLKT